MTAADSQAGGEKRRASLISLLVVIALIALKITVGLVSGSLAVMAQAADSVLDLVATILAFFAVRVAEKPPDRSHPYGHGKVENLAALAETLLLLATCGWIAYEAVRRLLFKPAAIESGLWAIAVMVVSIVVSLWLSTYLMAVAHRQRSQSLEGNALNFRTDVLSSSAVLLGLVLVQLGQWLGPEWSWLGKADPVVALLMAIFVAKTSLQLGWRSVSELLDAAPPGLAEQIRAEAEAVPGVLSVEAVRVRQSGAATDRLSGRAARRPAHRAGGRGRPRGPGAADGREPTPGDHCHRRPGDHCHRRPAGTSGPQHPRPPGTGPRVCRSGCRGFG